LVDNVVILNAVRVVAVGRPQELRGHYAVRPSYEPADVEVELAYFAREESVLRRLKGTKTNYPFL